MEAQRKTNLKRVEEDSDLPKEILIICIVLPNKDSKFLAGPMLISFSVLSLALNLTSNV